MKVSKSNLLEFIGVSEKTLVIPMYQRDFAWGKAQGSRLFEDIERVAKMRAAGENSWEHFIGTVVFSPFTSEFRYEQLILIDGQQRITTVSLLILALANDAKSSSAREEILARFIFNPEASSAEGKTNYRIKLKASGETAVDFEQIASSIQQGYWPSEETPTGKMYGHFKDLIRESKFTRDQLLEAISGLVIVSIELDNNNTFENPQLIFESINSTGVKLSQSDLIRNLLLLSHSYDKQIELYENYWQPLEERLTEFTATGRARSGLDAFFQHFITKQLDFREKLGRPKGGDFAEVLLKKSDIYEGAKKLLDAIDPSCENIWDLMENEVEPFLASRSAAQDLESEPTSTALQTPRKIQTALKPNEKYYLDVTANFTGRILDSFSFDDDTVFVSSWKELLRWTALACISEDEERFKREIFENNAWMAGRGETARHMFRRDYHGLYEPTAVTKGVCMEGRWSISQVIKMSLKLAAYFGLVERINFTVEGGVNKKLLRRRRTISARSRYGVYDN